MWLSDGQKIGVGLTAFGLFFMFMGVLLLFDAGLMAIGNLLFLGGVMALIGLHSVVGFFSRKEKLKGTLCFLGGIVLVLVKYPFIGFAVELFGFINLFGDFFPTIFGFLKRFPVIGPILSHPVLARFVPSDTRA